MSGARTATSTAIASMATPSRPIRCRRNERHARRGMMTRGGATGSRMTVIGSSLADPWVQPAVDQLGHKVGDHHRESDEQKSALEDRAVAVADGVDGQRAEPWPRVHRLHLDRARYGEAKVERDQRDHGEHRVAESVVADDA